MALLAETEPNDTTATANALAGSEAVVYGTIDPAADVDYFSFTANAGDRVSVATMTQFSNGGSTDTNVSIIASDGTTVLENDNDSGHVLRPLVRDLRDRDPGRRDLLHLGRRRQHDLHRSPPTTSTCGC